MSFRRPVPCEQGAADLSAPCGASTAAPSLCRSALWCVRLLQLLAFCKTVNGCYAISFSEGFWQFLIVRCSCLSFGDLQKYVLKQCQHSTTICHNSIKKDPVINHTFVTNPWKWSRNLSKIIKIMLWAPRAASVAPVASKTAGGRPHLWEKGVIFSKNQIWGAIFGTSRFRRRSQNHVFGYHVRKMMKKGCPKTRPEKTSKFDRKFIPKWEGLGNENEGFAGDLLQNKDFRGIVK